jgi:thiopeptide-type bacteriocin biosynthesis protein
MVTPTSQSWSCPSCGSSTPGARAGGALAWRQINVALPDSDASGGAFFSALAPSLPELRGGGGGSCFWFVRKEPGLRLRFGGEAMTADVAAIFDALVASGAVTSWFSSVYEPETHQFGGPEAMDAAHRWFDRDTAAWFAWNDLGGRQRITPNVLSLAVLVDLFERCLEAREEVWDVAENLAHLYAAPPDDTAAPAIGLSQLGQLLREVEPVAAIYRDANAALAGELAALWRRGALTAGRRGILPFVAAFHWNRYRAPLVAITRIVGAMRSAYDPKAGFIGAAP